MNIDVRADISGVRLAIDALERERVAAAVRGLTRAAEGARTDAVKALRPIYPGLKAGAIRSRIKVEKASRGKLVSYARFSRARIPMYGNFGMRGKGQFGVRFSKLPYRVETPEGDVVDPAMLERAFRNRLLKGGRPTVLARVGKSRRPITVLLAPGLGQAIVERKLVEAIAAGGRRRFITEYTRYMSALVARRAARVAAA